VIGSDRALTTGAAAEAAASGAATPKDAAAEAAVAVTPRSLRAAQSAFLTRFGGLAVFVAMIAFFSVAAPHTFPTLGNGRTILDQAAVLLILGAGLTVVLIIGQFDLSFASTIGLAGAVSAIASAHWGLPAWLALLAAIAVGAAVGLGNGLAVAYGKAPAFIVTLASSGC
jgi:ribose/xylose/arabinose/galactoside ABC-type transport system permease subunit